MFADQNNFEKQLGKRIGSQRQNTIYSNIILKNIDTWDYQWFYTIWKNRGYTIQPTINLIKNIGFDELATHTKSSNHTLNSMVASKKDFNKIRHPKTIEINPNYVPAQQALDTIVK